MKSLTIKEKEIEWLKNQRKRIEKSISEVVIILLNENMKPHYRPKYRMEFSISMAGNCADLRIYSDDVKEVIETVDIYGISFFLEAYEMYFNKNEAEKHSVRILKDLQKMKMLCLKYSKLN